jgi:hypothetical protein
VAVITADVEGLTDSAEVAVAQQVTGLDVSPSSLTLTALGAAVRVDAVPTDANGHPVDNAAVTWTSLAPAIASVDESGLVTAVSNGNATIVAITDGVADSVPATVAQRAKSVAVEPVDTTITGILDAVRFRGVGLDSLGNAVPDQMLSWSFVPSSTDTLLFVVDSAGLGRAFNDGAGSVVAEDSSGATGTTTLSVSAGVMPINYGDILTGTVSVSTQTVAYRPPEWRRGTVAWVAPSPLLAGALDPSLYVAPVRGVDTLVAGGDYDAVRGPEGPNPITGEELLVRLDDGATPATVVVAGGKGTIGGFTLGLQACRVLDTLSISSSTVSDSLTSQDCLVYNGTGDPKNNGGGNRPFAVLAPVTLAGGLTSAQLVVERLSITTDDHVYAGGCDHQESVMLRRRFRRCAGCKGRHRVPFGRNLLSVSHNFRRRRGRSVSGDTYDQCIEPCRSGACRGQGAVASGSDQCGGISHRFMAMWQSGYCPMARHSTRLG